MSEDERQHPEGDDESVDSLLRAMAHPSTVDVPADFARGATPMSVRQVVMPAVGDVVGGRYELTEVLGAGGMGAVFAAKHRGTGREVAIKILLPSQRGAHWKAERLARFVREAKAAGRIRHPNVVDVYDVEGSTEPPYLVMERLHGESLWQRIKRGPLAPAEAVDIVQQAMRGVAEAHSRGVIHRDLKPDNIFLARVEGCTAAVPKVLDFGVSRIVTRDQGQNSMTLTRTGHVVGTPSYMPLEQLRGRLDVDARADVYALGVILYEAICGSRPHQAENDHELVIRMVTEAPKPMRELAAVDAFLEAVVMKALAREPQGRHPDVQAFAAELTRWQAGERGMPAAVPVEPAFGQRRLRLALAALLITLVVAALLFWQTPSATPASLPPLTPEAAAVPLRRPAAPTGTTSTEQAPAPSVVQVSQAPTPAAAQVTSAQADPAAQKEPTPEFRKKGKFRPPAATLATPEADRETTLKADEF